MKPHKYADVIKAWADGKDIQYITTNIYDDKWTTWEEGINKFPHFYNQFFEWRIKPETLRYRVALIKNYDGEHYPVTDYGNWVDIENMPEFVKLLEDWKEVEV